MNSSLRIFKAKINNNNNKIKIWLKINNICISNTITSSNTVCHMIIPNTIIHYMVLIMII